ncbi:hypothetical protein [Undibacter mobilis]|nr:hypothetical protein [Undibacter mobilis]
MTNIPVNTDDTKPAVNQTAAADPAKPDQSNKPGQTNPPAKPADSK